MNHDLNHVMRDAARLTRGGQLKEAAALLQQFLVGKTHARSLEDRNAPADVLDGCVFELEAPIKALASAPAGRPDVPSDAPIHRTASPSVGQFLSGTHSHGSLTRQYKLYLPPAARAGERPPLIVMLHGCTQNPDDFAAGTGMNELAKLQGFFVLYPAQAQEANSSRCWNWFKHNHQQRDRGEPALIASLTQAVMREHGIDPGRVYIAGLSAGGAMAAIMGAAYPDVYAAVGVHSGLAPGVASNVGEALSAMNGRVAPSVPMSVIGRMPGPKTGSGRKAQALGIPAIVFHGDQDKTVSPSNGQQVIEARLASDAARSESAKTEHEASAKGRRYLRKVYRDRQGTVLAEHWLVHGAGHAWSGGHAAGSYTDALGPDASSEMLRFFFEHARHRA